MVHKKHYQKVLISSIFIYLSFLSGCTPNPATGGNDFTPFLPQSQEKQIGAKEHQKVVAEFGGVYNNNAISAYVAQIGGRVAAKSELPAGSYRFTVLDTPVVNAFALPGGYVYVTRGLLALANSEDELAGVLGHEIGHVTARHPARQSTANVVGNLGAALLGAVTGSDIAGKLAQVGATGILANYSRSQELEADNLGVRYIAKAGYDPYAQADFLKSLQANSDLSAYEKGQKPQKGTDFFSSHPATPGRVVQAIKNAQASGMKIGTKPRNFSGYFSIINGLEYGDSPDQGFVKGNTFIHPKMRFTFSVPHNFTLNNTSKAVVATSNDKAIISLDAVQGNQNPTAFLQKPSKSMPALQNIQQIDINGYPAATGSTLTQTNNGAYVYRVVAIAKDGMMYRMQMLAPQNTYSRYETGFQKTTYSFRGLSAAEANQYKPLRINIYKVKNGDTLESIASKMPFGRYNIEKLKVINAINSNNDLNTGRLIKLIN